MQRCKGKKSIFVTYCSMLQSNSETYSHRMNFDNFENALGNDNYIRAQMIGAPFQYKQMYRNEPIESEIVFDFVMKLVLDIIV